jgi:hypothetical protein
MLNALFICGLLDKYCSSNEGSVWCDVFRWIVIQLVQICTGIMARNTSSRGSCTNPFAQGLGSAKHKVAPAPPQLPDDARASTPTVDNNNQPKNGVTWPSGSIPRRVKKLSWDDESCQQRKVSVKTLHHKLQSFHLCFVTIHLYQPPNMYFCVMKQF